MNKQCLGGCMLGLSGAAGDCIEGTCHFDQKVICSFCLKSADEVDLIFAGIPAAICSECVLLCVEIAFKSGLNKKGIKQNQNPFAELQINGT